MVAGNRGSYKFDWHNRDLVEDIIKSSSSQSEALRMMGLSPESSAVTFKKYVSLYRIDVSHFSNVRLSRSKKPIEDWLVENSKYTSRWTLRRRLLREKLIDYICAKCGNDGEWNGQPISLQLEHKNGVNTDNRIENLEFLCPNCHSQTETFAGKNKKIKPLATKI